MLLRLAAVPRKCIASIQNLYSSTDYYVYWYSEHRELVIPGTYCTGICVEGSSICKFIVENEARAAAYSLKGVIGRCPGS